MIYSAKFLQPELRSQKTTNKRGDVCCWRVLKHVKIKSTMSASLFRSRPGNSAWLLFWHIDFAPLNPAPKILDKMSGNLVLLSKASPSHSWPPKRGCVHLRERFRATVKLALSPQGWSTTASHFDQSEQAKSVIFSSNPQLLKFGFEYSADLNQPDKTR